MDININKLKSLGIDLKDIKPIAVSCEKCNDRGILYPLSIDGVKRLLCRNCYNEHINEAVINNEFETIHSNMKFEDFVGDEHVLTKNERFTPSEAMMINTALSSAKIYAKTLASGYPQNLLFHGNPGTGKTMLSYAVKNFLSVNAIPTLVIDWVDFLDKIYDVFYAKIGSFSEAYKQIKNYSVILIDDLSHIPDTAASKRILSKIFDMAYKSNKSLIVTTNLQPEEFYRLIGQAATDRFTEKLTIIPMVYRSFRGGAKYGK